MEPSRRQGLAIALLVATGVTLFILKGLVGTIFFAVTVAYVAHPLTDRLEARGLGRRWGAAATTAAALLFGIGLFLPIAAVLYLRRGAAIALLRSLPAEVTLTVEEFVYVVDVGELITLAVRTLTRTAISLAEGTPVLAAKVGVFAFALYAILHRGRQLEGVVSNLAPATFQGELAHLHRRVRDTLYGLYVIQAATAIGTFAVALVLFLALGVRYPVTLAVLAGLLQFLPVVGPSLVIAGLVVAELAAGDLVGAATIGVLGIGLVGVLPDAVLRPWLAAETASMTPALYFVGLTGGLLSLGAVGIVAGPLAVALVAELVALLSQDSAAG